MSVEVISAFAVLIALILSQTPLKKNVLAWITYAWAVAWAIVAFHQPALWPVAALGFVQNVAFTFVSRGRNSGSLGYHLIASIFSNGIYAALLFTSIDMISQAKSMPMPFLIVYTLATMAGSIFAHWLALRAERGKARSVQEDRFEKLQRRVAALEESKR
jgi:predicted permease